MNRLLLALAALALTATVNAQDLTIRTIDMQYLFDNYYKTLRFESTISEDADMTYLENLEKERGEMRDTLRRLDNRMNSMMISEEAKQETRQEGARLLMQLREKEKDIERMRRKVDMRKAEERDVILNEIEGVVQTYSRENNIDMLIDISGRTLNGIPTIVYSNQEMNISKTILQALNVGHEDEVKELLGERQEEATEDAVLEDDDAARRAAEDAVMEGGGE